jgi:hypothetical protein
MKTFAVTLARLAAVAGLLIGLGASPALADHDDHHDRWRHHDRDRWEHHGGWNHRHHYRDYDRDYDRGYYYSEPQYYSAPRVYVPPPPVPSFGLNLVFPIH